MKIKFEDFLNESLRDKMKPKDREEVEAIFKKYKEGGAVSVYKDVIGKTIKSVYVVDDSVEDYKDDEIWFEFEDGKTYKMYHKQDCFESVYIEDINGDMEDLIGEPLLVAEEVTSDDPSASESGTWTFYKFATIKGYVDIRWHGISNGYYSEYVSFEEYNHPYPYPPKVSNKK